MISIMIKIKESQEMTHVEETTFVHVVNLI